MVVFMLKENCVRKVLYYCTKYNHHLEGCSCSWHAGSSLKNNVILYMIIHPITGNRYKLDSSRGRNLLKYYISQYKHGGAVEEENQTCIMCMDNLGVTCEDTTCISPGSVCDVVLNCGHKFHYCCFKGYFTNIQETAERFGALPSYWNGIDLATPTCPLCRTHIVSVFPANVIRPRSTRSEPWRSMQNLLIAGFGVDDGFTITYEGDLPVFNYRTQEDRNNWRTGMGLLSERFKALVDKMVQIQTYIYERYKQILSSPKIYKPDGTRTGIPDELQLIYMNYITDKSVMPSALNTVAKFEERELDTSFAAAYFPDVVSFKPSDRSSIVVPPSVVMLGAISLNDSLADPWFAPAGLQRGRLNASDSRLRMPRSVLDQVYDADINPIYVPAGRSGEVYAFGQKTLLQEQSALDRINVRRLLIDIRRKVRKVGEQLLFEPNRASTLQRFTDLVEPIMSNVQQRRGVTRYKVQIDTTTTTQNDIENNTIRGKIYLQPTKSVEFISLDFVVANTIQD